MNNFQYKCKKIILQAEYVKVIKELKELIKGNSDRLIIKSQDRPNSLGLSIPVISTFDNDRVEIILSKNIRKALKDSYEEIKTIIENE